MNRIQEKQNEIRFIKYLRAQRQAYSYAKRYIFLDLITILIALILPFKAIFNTFNDNLLIFGLIWAGIYLIAETFRKKRTEQGAQIQEEFDTNLFDLPWNEFLCGSKVNPDAQEALASKYHNNDLKNWYSVEVTEDLPQHIAVILCQRISFSWELNLRTKFFNALFVLAGVYYGSFAAYGLFENIGFRDFLLLISPSISFSYYIIRNFLAYKDQKQRKERILVKIDDILESYAVNGIFPKNNELRQIQDEIFRSRIISEKIPDWFYRLFKNKNEARTGEIIKSFKSRFLCLHSHI